MWSNVAREMGANRRAQERERAAQKKSPAVAGQSELGLIMPLPFGRKGRPDLGNDAAQSEYPQLFNFHCCRFALGGSPEGKIWARLPAHCNPFQHRIRATADVIGHH